MKRYAAEHYAVPAEKIKIVPNYVDMALFKPQPEVEKAPGRIIAIGRLHERKNLDLLIEAVAGLPNAHLVFAGDGPERAKLTRLAQSLNVDVQFAGAMANNELPALIATGEVYAMVSRFEGHPKTLIEAMGCGAAVCATDVEGISNIIVDGQNGRLCQPTAESIQETLSQMLGDNGTQNKLGAAAHRYALNHYALEKIIEQELAIYKTVVGGAA